MEIDDYVQDPSPPLLDEEADFGEFGRLQFMFSFEIK